MPCHFGRWLGPLTLAALTAAHATPPHTHHGAAGHAPGTPHTPMVPATPPVAATADPAATWRGANEAVGAFPRGHADIVRWERTHGHAEGRPAASPATDPWSLDEVARRVLLTRPDLLLTPGTGPVDVLRSEQDTAAAVRDAQAAWIDAVTARAARAVAEDMLAAAEAGADLAQRMRQVGNFSAERQLREALVQWDAEQRLSDAQQAEHQATVRLWQLIGGTDTPQALAHHLPAALPQRPALPAAEQDALARQARERHPEWATRSAEAQRTRAALPAGAWERVMADLNQAIARGAPGAPRLDPRAPRWPHAWEAALDAAIALSRLERQLDGDLTLALDAAQRAHERARRQQERVLPAARTLEEETLLRYNGMLVSTWDLLAAARERLSAQQAALAAERDAWLAWLDLQAVQAGLPYTGRAAAADTAATPAAKGH